MSTIDVKPDSHELQVLGDDGIEDVRRGVLARVLHPGGSEREDELAGSHHAGGLLVDPTEPKGPVVRRNSRAARRGAYAPTARPAPSTTRQGEILNPALIAAPLDEEGILIGRDRLSSSPVAHDPFTAYRNKQITSPSVLVLGMIGSGKSSLLKTAYVLRPMILRGRRVVVLDRKTQKGEDNEGEYSEIVRRYEGSHLRMLPGGGGSVINPMDPEILKVLGADGQFRLIKALADRANDGAALDPKWEVEALRRAYRQAVRYAEQAGKVPVLAHLIEALGVIDGVEEWSTYSTAAKERMHQAGLSVRHLLGSALADDLGGMFDGETSKDVRLDNRLTSFDISQLPQEGPATAMVLAVAQAWLLGTLRRDRGRGTNFLVEEGWDMVSGPIAKQMNQNQMLARGLGLVNVTAIHHLSQVPRTSEALSLIKEPQTIHIYRQERDDDVEACADAFGLDPETAEMLRTLDQGSHLLKIGSRPPIHVEHVRSSFEAKLTDTDTAMLIGTN